MTASNGTIPFLLNMDQVESQSAPGTVLLDVIRRERGLTGTKEACRGGDCGACMVLLGEREGLSRVRYIPANSCLLPLGAVAGRHVVTIEGLSGSGLNPIQQTLMEQGGIQCGFCTPGIVIALTAFFLNGAVSDIDAAIDAAAGNLCRCTGYSGIKRALQTLCGRFDLSRSPPDKRLRDCIQWKLLPPCFASIPARLAALPAPSEATSAADPAAVRVAGGTDLFVQRPLELCRKPLIFVPACESGKGIRIEAGECRIEAAATVELLRTSPAMQALFPTIEEDFKLICSAPIRQRATVGGNLANASPIGDLSVFFLALDAMLAIAGPGGERRIKLREFFQAYKTVDCAPGEWVREVSFELPERSAGYSFEKVGKRAYLDIASVNSACLIEVADGLICRAHLSAGGVGPAPLYLAQAGEFLLGKAVNSETMREAARLAQSDIAPISDSRGSAEYKRLLLRQLVCAHFLKLFPEQLRWDLLNIDQRHREALHETV